MLWNTGNRPSNILHRKTRAHEYWSPTIWYPLLMIPITRNTLHSEITQQNDMEQYNKIFHMHIKKQECIPVGCVPTVFLYGGGVKWVTAL